MGGPRKFKLWKEPEKPTQKIHVVFRLETLYNELMSLQEIEALFSKYPYPIDCLFLHLEDGYDYSDSYLEYRGPEPDSMFQQKMEHYLKDLEVYNTWYAANKEKADEFIANEAAENARKAAARAEKKRKEVTKKLKKLEKQMAETKATLEKL